MREPLSLYVNLTFLVKLYKTFYFHLNAWFYTMQIIFQHIYLTDEILLDTTIPG